MWSGRWLAGFKSRYKIRSGRRFGESGSAQLDEACAQIMADIQETARGYDAKDIYNMDETGFNWKAVLDTSLGISHHLGGKKEKARIAAVVYSE